MSRFKVRLEFLEPWRIAAKSTARGRSYARWVKTREGLYRPEITGTLVRAAVIRAAEELLALGDGVWEGYPCCPGGFFTRTGEKPIFRRQRATMLWQEIEQCSPENPCPLCLLLGRHDEAGKRAKRGAGFHIHFGNLYPSERVGYEKLDDLAKARISNRLDFVSGKAHDFLRIWEIPRLLKFTGLITMADDLSDHQAVCSLLTTASAFVDRLCGAACRLELQEVEAPGARSATSMTPATVPDVAYRQQLQKDIDKYVKELTEPGSQIKIERLRLLADAIRELRYLPHGRTLQAHLAGLPRGKEQEEATHFLWDLTTKSGEKVREVLQQAAHQYPASGAWREFSEGLGQSLYSHFKNLWPEAAPIRPVGEAEFWQVNDNDRDMGRQRGKYTHEWIILGTMEAVTPFYLGTEVETGRHTSLTVLLSEDGRYRLPRSALRGALRQDLHLASGGQGCLVELGPDRPCSCPICQIMRRLTIRDVNSSIALPPPLVRQRVRRNPSSGIVDEGALFDQEVAPEGLRFPFILRYRGHDALKKELQTVLSWWQAGQLFLGGASGTGKGRFQLHNVQFYRWEMKSAAGRPSYKEHLGYRGAEDTLKDLAELPLGLDSMPPSLVMERPSPWQEVVWQWHFHGPVLTNHPLTALLTGEADAVFNRKVKISPDQQHYQEVFTVKGETARGVIRSLLGKIDSLLESSHQDCQCLLCRVFGNEYQQGQVRFEDLIPLGPETASKRLDHVAIDRASGGAADQLKFDDQPLYGTPADPLIFEGRFWVHDNLDAQEQGALRQALQAHRRGLATVGAKGSIGYGWVDDLHLTTGPEWLLQDWQESAPPATLTTAEPATSEWPRLPAITLQPQAQALYYPHYFLPPTGVAPRRKRQPIAHSQFHRDKYTGWLTCRLTTLTPLIIPDTLANKASEMLDNPPANHQAFPFFRLGDTVMIPGSELRGMVSSVFEAVTNSCFRVFRPKMRLSWRMPAAEAPMFFPGRVKIETKNGKKQFLLQRMDNSKLPLYDDPALRSNFRPLSKTCNHTLTYVDDNRTFLNSNNAIRNGLTSTNLCFNRDLWLVWAPSSGRCTPGLQSKPGYVKFTGPNKVEVAKAGVGAIGLARPPANWTLVRNAYVVSNVPRFQAQEGGTIFTVTKRRERFFMARNNFLSYPVPLATLKRYEQVLEEYRHFAKRGNVPAVFRTVLPDAHHGKTGRGKLNAGDLVYFRVKDDKWSDPNAMVEHIIPVSISRLVDHQFLGERLPMAFRPCAHVCLEECETCVAQSCPLPFYREGAPSEGLCPACHLFGTTGYQGRVRFGFARPVHEPSFCQRDTGATAITLPLQEQPRLTWSMLKEERDKKDNTVSKREPVPIVPGRKFYVHHQGWRPIVENGINPLDGKPIEPSENNRTVEALATGQSFTFQVYVENLEKWELGLLLYSLELEPDLAHKLGMAKAWGFGSVQLAVENLCRYQGLGDVADITAQKGELRQAGFAWLEELEQSLAWHEIERLRLLRQLLAYQTDQNVSARYPLLRNDPPNPSLPPAYVDLRDQGYKPEEKLKIPWSPWWTAPPPRDAAAASGETSTPSA